MTHEEAVGVVGQLSEFILARRHGDRTVVARGTAMAHLRTGMAIDPVHDLDLGATGQEDRPILSVCHKPRRPQPPDRRYRGL